MKKKIVTIVGARPQFIKAAAVSRAIAQQNRLEEIIVHTGQHYDANMSDIFFQEMEIPRPQHQLGVHGKGHGAMTGQMLEKIEEVLLAERPALMLVYGDTNSTLAGALAAKKLHIPVAHVEAGLRSYNNQMPEEINRILTDRISDLLFAPTSTAVKNLNQEGLLRSAKIIQSGDVMYDVALYFSKKSAQQSKLLTELALTSDSFALATVHRAENTDDPVRLRAIFSSLNEIHTQLRVVMPLHPRTKKYVQELGIAINFTTIDPVGYLDMLALTKNCRLVLTDSGGLQKEAYFFARPCITLRDETEWVELIECGANALAGADQEKILSLFHNTLTTTTADYSSHLYGDGTTAFQVEEALAQF